MHKYDTKRQDLSRTPDIRRRIRSHSGPARHALRTLAESLRMRGAYLAGLHIVLIGFGDFPVESDASTAAHDIIATLRRYGASVRTFHPTPGSTAVYRAQLFDALRGANAVMIDTDSPHFRAVRPKELRDMGIDIIVPTTLNP